MSMRRQLERALSSGRPVRPEDSAADLATELVEHWGTRTAAAQAIGVSTTQLRRWITGESTPSDPARAKLEIAARIARLPAHIDTFQWGGTDHNDREFNVDSKTLQLLPDTMQAVIDAHVAGDRTAALAALANGITDHWYGPVFRRTAALELKGA